MHQILPITFAHILKGISLLNIICGFIDLVAVIKVKHCFLETQYM